MGGTVPLSGPCRRGEGEKLQQRHTSQGSENNDRTLVGEQAPHLCQVHAEPELGEQRQHDTALSLVLLFRLVLIFPILLPFLVRERFCVPVASGLCRSQARNECVAISKQ